MSASRATTRWAISLCCLVLVATAVAAQAQVFVASTGNDANPGTAAQPVATVAKALALVGAAGGEVHVAVGQYDGPILLPSGVAIIGGFKPDFSARLPALSDDDLRSPERDPAKLANQTVLTHRQGDRVVAADLEPAVRGGEATLSNLIVVGPDQTAKPGQSSYAIVVQGGGTLHLKAVKLIAGHGGPVVAAGKPGDAVTTLCTDGGGAGVARPLNNTFGERKCYDLMDGGTPWCEEATVQFCESVAGQEGFPVRDEQGKVLARGGASGPPGDSYCYTPGIRAPYQNKDPSDGKPGGRGQDGPAGDGGKAHPERSGWFVRLGGGLLQWTGEPGGQGVRGWPGASGGGGGAGGSVRAPESCIPRTNLGGVGGVGGKGGCGGMGGMGGQPGGGSFALVIQDAKVVTERFGILPGAGGSGGPGGDGGRGRPGADGTSGSVGYEAPCSYWTAGVHTRGSRNGKEGGPGGAGGQGGGGAGGNGGPSIAIARLGSATFHHSGTYHVGSGGKGGLGGTGGQVGGQPHGEPGQPGLEKDPSTFTVRTSPQNAQFISQSVAGSMLKGTTQTVSIQVKNTGGPTWTSAASYALGSQNPGDNGTWGLNRVALPASIAPEQTATFNFVITAPTTPGTYNFQWRMVQDAVAWFGDQTPNVAITVQP